MGSGHGRHTSARPQLSSSVQRGRFRKVNTKWENLQTIQERQDRSRRTRGTLSARAVSNVSGMLPVCSRNSVGVARARGRASRKAVLVQCQSIYSFCADRFTLVRRDDFKFSFSGILVACTCVTLHLLNWATPTLGASFPTTPTGDGERRQIPRYRWWKKSQVRSWDIGAFN